MKLAQTQFHNEETRRTAPLPTGFDFVVFVWVRTQIKGVCNVRRTTNGRPYNVNNVLCVAVRFAIILWLRTNIKILSNRRGDLRSSAFGFAQSSRLRTHTARLPPRGGSCGSRWRRVRNGTHRTNPVVSQAPSTASGPPPSRREAFLEFAQT